MAPAFLCASVPARADSKTAACISAHADGQLLRRDKRLIESADRLRACAVEACPEIIRKDCHQFLEEVEERLPTLVVVAVDGRGRDLPDVSVSVDGKHVTSRLEGSAIAVDPGQHRLRFSRSTGEVRDQFIVVRETEKGRRVLVEFTISDQGGEGIDAAPRSASAGIPTATYVLGGVGVAALGSFAVFALNGRSTENELEDCAPRCRRADVDTMRRQYLAADISLAIGIASLGAATYFWLSNRASLRSGKTQEPALEVRPVFSLGGLSVAAGARF